MTRIHSIFLAVVLSVAPACGEEPPAPPTQNFVVINEVVAANSTVCADDQGEYDDWIELYNKGDVDQSMGGFYITDNPDVPLKKRLTDDLVVPAKGVLQLWADKDPEQGSAHLPFKVSALGETIQLRDPAEKVVDELVLPAATVDTSYARFPDGEGPPTLCLVPTCKAINGPACAQ